MGQDEWVKWPSRRGSWHILAGITARSDRPGWLRMYCGRLMPPGTPTLPEPPSGERTCERCYQLRERAS